VQDCSHSEKTLQLARRRSTNFGVATKAEVSNSDQLLSDAWAIMTLETSTSSLSFRSSELSQPI
jgi:uncharacterized protein YfaA (DUF2138 family)